MFNDPTDVQPTRSLATLPHLREVVAEASSSPVFVIGFDLKERLGGCNVAGRRCCEINGKTQRLANGAMPHPWLIEQFQQPRLVHRQRIATLACVRGRPSTSAARRTRLPRRRHHHPCQHRRSRRVRVRLRIYWAVPTSPSRVPHVSSAIWLLNVLLAYASVSPLTQQVGVTQVAGVLVDHFEQHLAQ